GRMFQQARLLDGLTVSESVQFSLERIERSEVVPSVLALPPSWRAERRKRNEAQDIIDLFGLGAYAERGITELSTGMRRLAELAFVVAHGAAGIPLGRPPPGSPQAEGAQSAPESRRH